MNIGLKKQLKRISIVAKANAKLKAARHKYLWGKISNRYLEANGALLQKYSVANALENYQKKLAAAGIVPIAKKSGDLNIFWVGASKDQDESGFLQGLRKLGNVTCFHNWKNEYGLWLKDESNNVTLASEQACRYNHKSLVEQVAAAHKIRPIDVLIGQMWANYLSSDTLRWVHEQGIPIINISMDDRLPDNWLPLNNKMMGAIGLKDHVDIVLTTSKETCEWYWVEQCPALFWPLASSPEVFNSNTALERDIDVLFIGNKYGYRQTLIEGLAEQGVDVECRGAGWSKGPASAEESALLFGRAKIILGIGTVGHCDDVYTLKLRDFDAPMSGGLYITHRNPDLLDLYAEGVEIACYSSIDECAEKIDYYLSNQSELRSIAKAGNAKALARDTWDNRLKETLETLGFLEA
jgi:spore maturation protein CgeB